MPDESTKKPTRKAVLACLAASWVVILIGYMRVSKSDSSQVLHLQRDVLLIVTEGEPVAPLASPMPTVIDLLHMAITLQATLLNVRPQLADLTVPLAHILSLSPTSTLGRRFP